jgi:hypothetical protein
VRELHSTDALRARRSGTLDKSQSPSPQGHPPVTARSTHPAHRWIRAKLLSYLRSRGTLRSSGSAIREEGGPHVGDHDPSLQGGPAEGRVISGGEPGSDAGDPRAGEAERPHRSSLIASTDRTPAR